MLTIRKNQWRFSTFSYIFCLSLASIFIMTSIALDTLSATESISDGQTLVSAGGSFELGFFSLGKSKYYLGIWFKKISNGTTIAWVGNRETPLTNSTGVLKFNDRGILVLVNQDKLVIWSSNISRIVKNPVAQLLDSGNLVIREENNVDPENYLWQSFHYPDRTFLPGMKMGTLAGGLYVYISSWKSEDNPSRGNLTGQLDPSGLQLIVTRNSAITARSGPWNGFGFSGMPFIKENPVFNYDFVHSQKENYYTYDLVNSSVYSRLVLAQNGIMERYTWIDRTSDWGLYSSAPSDNCDTYALCGAHGNCDISNSPVCLCLKGFLPKHEDDWNRADWSGGCIRRTPLDCEKGDGFMRFTNVKLPDMLNFSMDESMTLEECKMTCLENCSCMAYANSDIRGSGSGCFLWFGDLIDVRQYREDGQDLYIRMASSELAVENHVSSSHKKQRVIIASTATLAGLILVLGLGLFIRRKKKQNAQGTQENLDIPHFHFHIIAKATNNFSSNNMLGEGGFGPVYKGLLKEGQEVAVKRLAKDSNQGLDEFKNEVKYIAKLQHRNLVKLLGYCIYLEERMLIYEYMPNKSLDFYIFDETQSKLLDWPMRFRIINGISRGLLYLHHDSRLRIIHRDLKLSNILLDNEMNPKISDFGIARSFGGNETEANTNRVVGTYGYMSPEYAIDGLFSIKSDVYSFGVLVLEIINGKRNRGFSHPGHQLNLLGHAWKLFKEGRYQELIDALIMESCNLSQVLRTVHVGLLCVQHSPEDRPSMSSVILMLSGEGALPEPKEPGFFTERRLFEADSSSSNRESWSVNEVTITMIESR